MTAKLSIPTADVDQLPREKGWSYDEIARIIGSLYLDSHHRIAVIEDQLTAVSNESQRIIQAKQREVDQLTTEVASLRRELELRNASTASNFGTHAVSGTE